jgi:hypothetical protein
MDASMSVIAPDANQTAFQFSGAELEAKKIRFLKPEVAVAQAA